MNIIRMFCCMLAPLFFATDLHAAEVSDKTTTTTTPQAVTETKVDGSQSPAQQTKQPSSANHQQVGSEAAPKQTAKSAEPTPAASKKNDDSKATDNKAEDDAESEALEDEGALDDGDDDLDDEATAEASRDPLEKLNRFMFNFNETIDKAILKPVALLYNKIMPKPLNAGIHNVYYNLGTVTTVANDLLQGNFYQATNDTWRIAINTTIGIGGLFDMATRMKLDPFQNDFGLTLARWGWSNSTYLVLPFFGPNSIRDGLGIPVDYFAFSVYPYIQPERTRYQVYALGVVDRRAQLLKFENVLEEAAVDKYIFVRNAYFQNRKYKIYQVDHMGLKDRAEMNNPDDSEPEDEDTAQGESTSTIKSAIDESKSHDG